jgi:hypothetical protein
MADHFTDELWSDYVRGLAPERESTAIEQHLRDACEACDRSFQFWQMVTEHASREADYEPGAGVVRLMQSGFRDWWRRYVLPTHARIARTIFDSFLEPLPSGVRGGSPQPRRLRQRSGNWIVDLQLAPEAGRRMSLAGQVLKSGKAPSVIGSLAICLMSAGALLGETSTNELGEFQIEFDRAKSLRVFVEVPWQRPIGIALPDPDEPEEVA